MTDQQQPGPQQPGDWHLHGRPAHPGYDQDHAEFSTNLVPPAAWAPPTADQQVSGRRPLTSRGRSWLLFVTVGCLVLMYLLIWIRYADTHQTDRYIQIPPGEASATSVSKTQYRVHNLVKTEQLNNPGRPDEPEVAEAGTIFVVAEVEVLRQAEDDLFYCKTDLAVAGIRRIETSSPYLSDTALPTRCESDKINVGQPYRFLAVFTVPKQFADQIYGIAVQYTDYGEPFQVIRPPE